MGAFRLSSHGLGPVLLPALQPAGPVSSPAFAIDWDRVNDPQEAGRVGDGKREIVAGGAPAAGHPTQPAKDDLNTVRVLAHALPAKIAETRARWTGFVRGRHAEGKRVAIRGGGSKGVSFLTTNDLGPEVSTAIDVNPFKRGKNLPGTGHRVAAPGSLKGASPDTVIVMNPVYLEQIGADLASMDLHPGLVAV